LKSLLETGAPLPPETIDRPEASQDPEGDWHRSQGITCNNSIWGLLAAEPSDERDEELLRAAYASAFHWARAARRTPVNGVRADYMLGKAHLAAGLAERALHYAERTMAGCVEHGLIDFDLAYARDQRSGPRCARSHRRVTRSVGRRQECPISIRRTRRSSMATSPTRPEHRCSGDEGVPLAA
jgi:hypothetical protein